MRKALFSTVASLAIILPIHAHAADITQAGADEIKEKLTYYLPKDIVDTGFLKVTPGSQRYELSLDLMPLLKDVDKKDFSINGLKPFIHYLTPQDDGMWKVELNDHFDVNGNFTAEGKKQNFTYKIEKMTFDGIFDPSISYFTTGISNLDKLNFTATGGDVDIKMSVDQVSTDMKSNKIADGIVDMSGSMSMKNITETVSSKTPGDMVLSAESMTGTIEANRLGVNALRDLIIFGLDLAKADTKSLDPAQSEKLKTLLKANVPFADKFEEKLQFQGVKVSMQGMGVSFGGVTYGVGFDGIKPDSSAHLTFGISKPVIPAGLLPAGTDAALPETANFDVAITGLNLEGAVNYMIEHADFAKSDPLTPAQSDELGKIVLPGGKMNFAFSDVYAKSAVYDVALSGKMLVDPDDTKKPEVDVTIRARDLDKTVKFLQDNAKTVPAFGQASFGVLMAKGFGKMEADGTTVWHVKMDTAGKLTINDQALDF